eukprot:6062202-Ditylum_brightwellii.AAC.1
MYKFCGPGQSESSFSARGTIGVLSFVESGVGDIRAPGVGNELGGRGGSSTGGKGGSLSARMASNLTGGVPSSGLAGGEIFFFR